jgi:hypothetical protein
VHFFKGARAIPIAPMDDTVHQPTRDPLAILAWELAQQHFDLHSAQCPHHKYEQPRYAIFVSHTATCTIEVCSIVAGGYLHSTNS